ncbi:Gluconate 2-dehydrogenase subunit 3 [Robiginitalea myxolifaciens]|uniref:Gluconate 2-dehydrogenase subunit 3 n=1 Tax=Robiginitalea myxolifaciens TaxID=400055 RepID=A0A1I6FZF7_9FLAO|nr:gluconate 2-dehydrogenase subunit 3 family protein [Robiginitalea myxolifaciens]SFR35312.1 Gluconate 2-dehydrogenase subunit 3 [Robiginitalea myxolifaciens]
MERRAVLKNMGLAMGAAVATPTLLSILQSCQGETGPVFTPVFFSQEEGDVLLKTVDIILPKTDTPSASELQVHAFIDKYMDEVVPLEEQEMLRMGMGAFVSSILEASGKESAADIETADIEPVLAEALVKLDEEEEMAMNEAMMAYFQAMEAGEEATLDDKIASRGFAQNMRGAAIWAYKSSEYIGEEVLAYLPVPGEYVPCGDVDELTGGKAWSI